MLYSHPALVQNSHWNPGRSCQVVINYCGSQGSVLQTDLHELRGFSSRSLFRIWSLGLQNTKGTDPVSFSSACRPGATATQRSTQAQQCCFPWKAGGQQGNGPVQAALPWNRAFHAKITSLSARQLKHIRCGGGGHRWALLLRMKGRDWGREQMLFNFTSVAEAQSISYPKKWQDVTQHSCELRSISIRGKFIVFPALGNPSFITKWDVDYFALPSVLNLVCSGARTTWKASSGCICVVHFSWIVKKAGKSCFAVETEKSQLLI